jgi:hypothetical protein
MNNMECVVGTLARHREARMWSDDAVAADLLAQLGLKPDAEAKNAIEPPDPDVMAEHEVAAFELAAKEASDKATAARQAVMAKAADEAKAKADEAAATAKATQDAARARDATTPRAPAPTPAAPTPAATVSGGATKAS